MVKRHISVEIHRVSKFQLVCKEKLIEINIFDLDLVWLMII